MANQGVDQKPSETALFAALRRALAHQVYGDDKFGPDYHAEIFLPPHFRFFLKFQKIRDNTREKLNEALPGLTEYMIARTVYFDQVYKDALKEKLPQIVLLGAGYDTRAFRFQYLSQDTKVFELDIFPTQERKSNCLNKKRIEFPQNYFLLPIDFNQDSLLDVLQRGGWNGAKRTLFIWEGVSYYLERDSVSNTLAFFRNQTAPDSIMAFDYTISLTEDNMDDYYGARGFKQTMAEHHANEALLFSLSEDEMETFLKAQGFTIKEHLNNQEIEKRFLTDENGTLIGKMTGHFRFLKITNA
jgi:methyltransferase (TIGR00027 family)